MTGRTIGVAVLAVVSLGGLLLLSLLRAPPSPVGVVDLVQLAFAYAFLCSTSGFVVAGALYFAGTEPREEDVDTGRAVGKIENVLVLTLTILGAWDAIAIVFAAKSILRWQDLSSEDTTYYLTGSIANVTYSLLVGLLLFGAMELPLL